MTDKQKRDIYAVRAKYAVKQQKLKEEMEALRISEAIELEGLLSVAQKNQLKELTKGSAK